MEHFQTNADKFGFTDIQIHNSNTLRIDAVLAIAKFQDFCKANKIDFDYSVLYISLLEEGALEVPLVFKSKNTGYSVFFIYNAEDARKYNDAAVKILKTAYPNAIYFSCIDLAKISDKAQSTRTLQLADLRFEKEAKLSGEYAMWWADDEETTFWNSETKGILATIYEIHEDYESIYTGYLLHQIGLSTEFGRALLPEDEKALVLHAPENKNILLVLSQEKGIRFLFPVKSTTRLYREQFLSALRVDFLSLRLSLQQQEIPKDEKLHQKSIDWFKFMAKTTEENEKKGQIIQNVGVWISENSDDFGLN
ncbi:MAG: hypothetical protein P1P88_13605 [Bacteroidales bacterium]|nr:hypothetical protein [Bacteroidales bacterium]